MGRRRLALAAASVAIAAGLALSGCDTEVGAAAVVGGQRYSDQQLQDAVNAALAAPGVHVGLASSSYKGDLGAYRRAVLRYEVVGMLADLAAQRAGVTVGAAEVDARLKYYQDQAGGAAAFASTLASTYALSADLTRVLVRTEVVEAELGYARGGAQRPTDAALSQLYATYAAQNATATLRLIQVPDAATAARVAASLTRNPGSFAAVAAQYQSQPRTAPNPQSFVESQLPADLTAKIRQLKPGDVLAYALAGSSPAVYFVLRFDGEHRPTLDQSRPTLESQSQQQAVAAGQKYLTTVADQVGIRINPRYGQWDPATLTIKDFVNPAVRPVATTPSGQPSPGVPVAPGGAGSG